MPHPTAFPVLALQDMVGRPMRELYIDFNMMRGKVKIHDEQIIAMAFASNDASLKICRDLDGMHRKSCGPELQNIALSGASISLMTADSGTTPRQVFSDLGIGL
jgi:hypothetical protein